MPGMRRRNVVTLLCGAAAAWPLAARAEQAPTPPVIGWVGTTSPRPMETALNAFRRGLNEIGYFERQNVAIEYRWAEGQLNRISALVAELVGQQVAVIVAANGTGPARAAKAATSTIPSIFVYGGDPVRNGLVASFNRPGGNVTGVTVSSEELVGKRLDLLRAVVPQAKAVGFLSGPAGSISYDEQKSAISENARALGLRIVMVECRSDRDFEMAFATLIESQAAALIVGTFPFDNMYKAVLLAARHKIPTIYPGRGLIAAGGLIGYGANFTDAYIQAGIYAGRILKGEKPADLPVLQPTKFELVINVKTTKALGIEVPQTLLAIAGEVIE